MKTKAKNVQVLVKSCGNPVIQFISIRTDDGQLMTDRLERILSDSLEGCYPGMEVVRVVWQCPYTILSELIRDRIALQNKILSLESSSILSREIISNGDAVIIPEEAPDSYISQMVLYEIRRRRELKQKLLKLTKTH